MKRLKDPIIHARDKKVAAVRNRERYATDPEYREKYRARNNMWQRERYATDPEFYNKKNLMGKKRLLERKRESMFNQQMGLCPLCHKEIRNPNETFAIHIHHIIPRSIAEVKQRWNLCLVHAHCNSRKRNKFEHDDACLLMYQIEQEVGYRHDATAEKIKDLLLQAFAYMRQTGKWIVNFPI